MTYSILVVEDEDDVREVVATSLRHRETNLWPISDSLYDFFAAR